MATDHPSTETLDCLLAATLRGDPVRKAVAHLLEGCDACPGFLRARFRETGEGAWTFDRPESAGQAAGAGSAPRSAD